MAVLMIAGGRPEDLPGVQALLRRAGLSADVADLITDFLVAR